ncbi:TraK family protein [Novosphingobium terrae]|uniref:TraK family protein n=1 Tax=Novosphingobium terrae TaxID=2726189 RepID=UPI00197F255B
MEPREKRLVERMKAARTANDKTSVGKRRWFRAISGEVREALEDGETARAIWEHLRTEQNCPVNYVTFTIYCRRMLEEGEAPSVKSARKAGTASHGNSRSSAPVPASAPALAPPPALPAPTMPRPDTMGRVFIHDPNPRKEDLI